MNEKAMNDEPWYKGSEFFSLPDAPDKIEELEPLLWNLFGVN